MGKAWVAQIDFVNNEVCCLCQVEITSDERVLVDSTTTPTERTERGQLPQCTNLF